LAHRKIGGAALAVGMLFAAWLLSVMPAAPLLAEQQEARYEEQYRAETDPVRQAKILAKLGPIEVNAAGAESKSDQDEQALSRLQHLRDEVQRTAQALADTGVDASRHASGFKELQIGLRQTVRRLDDLIFALPLDSRPPFEAVRSDLAASENSLIAALFPPSPKKKGKKEQAN